MSSDVYWKYISSEAHLSAFITDCINLPLVFYCAYMTDIHHITRYIELWFLTSPTQREVEMKKELNWLKIQHRQIAYSCYKSIN